MSDLGMPWNSFLSLMRAFLEHLAFSGMSAVILRRIGKKFFNEVGGILRVVSRSVGVHDA